MALAWAAAPLLPRVAAGEPAPRPMGGGSSRSRTLGPAVLAPLVAVWLPFRPVPVPVADYLALHFLLYGLVTGLVLWLGGRLPGRVRAGPLAVAVLAVAAFAVAHSTCRSTASSPPSCRRRTGWG
jgi:hypothetical protein